jgi:predicted ester cyclase
VRQEPGPASPAQEHAEPLRGRQSLQEDTETAFTAFPGFAAELRTALFDGDVMAPEMMMTGTHTGTMATPEGTLPPTGKTVKIPVATFNLLDDTGLSVEERRCYDMAGFDRQLCVA